MTYVYKHNTETVRNALGKAGVKLCRCCSFKNAVWLSFSGVTDMVHGEGYSDETDGNRTVDEVIKRFENDCNDICYCHSIDEFINNIKTMQR